MVLISKRRSECRQTEGGSPAPEHASRSLRRDRRHGIAPAAPTLERVAVIGPCDTDFPLGAIVPRFQILIGDGPVRQRGAFRHAIARRHPKIVRHEAPGHPAIHEGSAAQTGGIGVVAVLMGTHDFLVSMRIDEDPGIAVEVGTGVVTVGREPMVPQMVSPATVRIGAGQAALDQENPFPGLGQDCCDDTASCACAHDDRIIVGHRLDLLCSLSRTPGFQIVRRVSRAGAYCLERSLCGGRTTWPFREAMLVSDHGPGSRIRIAAIAGISVITFGHQLGEHLEPWFRGNVPQDLILLVIGQILEHAALSNAGCLGQCRDPGQDTMRLGNGAQSAFDGECNGPHLDQLLRDPDRGE